MSSCAAAPRRPLILASSSPYRQALLSRLGLPFIAASPAVDETPASGETGAPLAQRLARAKAAALATAHPQALIIGSDQTATLDGRAIGKPADRDAAIAQLLAAGGREIVFDTAVCVLDAASGERHERVVPTIVEFRASGRRAIEYYVDREPALDCAGAFKAEALGIALCRRIESADPTALIGLPLIALLDLLEVFGQSPLAPSPVQ